MRGRKNLSAGDRVRVLDELVPHLGGDLTVGQLANGLDPAKPPGKFGSLNVLAELVLALAGAKDQQFPGMTNL